jgi:hypothetical protein
MWRHYRFRGLEVVIIQQWTDPFGRKMVRIEAAAEADLAEGMTEAEFLAEAVAAEPTPCARE